MKRPSIKSNIKKDDLDWTGYDILLKDNSVISFKDLQKISTRWKLIVVCPWGDKRGAYLEKISVKLVMGEQFLEHNPRNIKIKYTKGYGYLIGPMVVYGLWIRRYEEYHNKDLLYSTDSGIILFDESGSLDVSPAHMEKTQFFYQFSGRMNYEDSLSSNISHIKQLASLDILDLYETTDMSYVTIDITII